MDRKFGTHLARVDIRFATTTLGRMRMEIVSTVSGLSTLASVIMTHTLVLWIPVLRDNPRVLFQLERNLTRSTLLKLRSFKAQFLSKT